MCTPSRLARLCVGLVLVSGIWACGPAGVTVTVTNASSTPLQSVTAHYTGGHVALGTIAPGQRRAVLVDPSGESNIALEISADGKVAHREAGTYFENGYRGTVDITVGPDLVVTAVSDVRVR